MQGRDDLGDLDVVRSWDKIKTYLSYVMTILNGFIWLGVGSNGGHLSQLQEPSGSIKCGQFLDCLSHYKFLNNDSSQ